jgi:hypothetical protein
MNSAASIQDLHFGIEIETQGISRASAQRAIHSVIGGRMHRSPGYDRHSVTAEDGRTWNACSDASIGSGAEVVSPKLKLADMDTVQNIVRALRAAGARVSWQTGIHVHVDASRLDAPAMGRLTAMVYKHEDLIKQALNLDTRRQNGSYRARPITEKVAKAMKKARSLDAAATSWYRETSGDDARYARRSHYHNSRYHGLNLHSPFFLGTVEFRWFDATLHAGKVRAYVCLCLAMVATAMNAKQAPVKKVAVASEADGGAKWTMYCWLYYRLGLKGAEMKNVRDHLTKNLPGFLRGGNTPRASRQAAA